MIVHNGFVVVLLIGNNFEGRPKKINSVTQITVP